MRQLKPAKIIASIFKVLQMKQKVVKPVVSESKTSKVITRFYERPQERQLINPPSDTDATYTINPPASSSSKKPKKKD